MWGLSIDIWEYHGIDFIKLMDLEGTELAHSRNPAQVVYNSATNLTLVFLVIFIHFNKVKRGVFGMSGSLPLAHAMPVIFMKILIFRAVFPFETRKKWLGMLGKVLAAPFYPVVFRDGYVGDLLTSLVKVTIECSVSFIAWVSNHDNCKCDWE
jgi:hypothetical protein